MVGATGQIFVPSPFIFEWHQLIVMKDLRHSVSKSRGEFVLRPNAEHDRAHNVGGASQDARHKAGDLYQLAGSKFVSLKVGQRLARNVGGKQA